MTWLVFTYSLPAAKVSSPRVSIWRKLSRIGAVNPHSGVHILPSREECLSSFQWLGKEVKRHDGDCLLMKVESFEGMTNAELIGLFQEKSDCDYADIEKPLSILENKSSRKKLSHDTRLKYHAELQKLRKAQAEILKTDYFNAPAGARIVSRLERLDRLLSDEDPGDIEIPKVSKADYQHKVWVTRPRPHVDRLSSAWLIKRYIDQEAEIRYAKAPEANEIGFDMKEGGTFGHVGKFCTFETLLTAFGLEDVALWKMAEIVHEIDLRDGFYIHPEIAGLDLILKGWLLTGLTDKELEVHGTALFEGLFQALQRQNSAGDRRTGK